MSILVFVKSEKTFLKILEGAGDNLLDEDIDEGYVGYVLWSTFKPECIDLDSELDMQCLESGQVLLKKHTTVGRTLPACYRMAFNKKYRKKDVIKLLDDKED